MNRRREEKEATKRSKTMEEKSLMLLLHEEDEENCLMIHRPSRLFECKTCNRHFTSFQALGGHRASHKKPRFTPGYDVSMNYRSSEPMKPKLHECLVCGLEFPTGQALGGHMRRHRSTIVNKEALSLASQPVSLQVPRMKNANVRRVLCIDLNLFPPENDLDRETRSESPEKRNLPILRNFL